MCGIVGYYADQGDAAAIPTMIAGMKKAIRHRGPDGDGEYFDRSCALGLGHQRLAIIDPEHGAQPLTTMDGRYTVVFNGAIYNYLELRRELIAQGHPIKTYSDTEIIPYAYAEWGKDCVQYFRGMFAFAIWDSHNKSLFCARDRVGIKPFYYYFQQGKFIFASEIKAILANTYVKATADTQGLQDYITFQFCLEDITLFDKIQKLEPGHWLLVKPQSHHLHLEKKQYWDINYDINSNPDEKHYIDQLISLLEDAVRIHLRSDVPLGAHLSGGLDSSAVACLTAKMLTGTTFKTFTGAFREGAAFDETVHARSVAASIHSDYHEIFIPSHEVVDILPRLIHFMDEPMAGPGLIPQYYVSKLAAEHVKVVLGGQGGDELYIGYARYFIAYLEKCLAAAIWPEQINNDGVDLNQITPNLPLLQEYKPMLKHAFSKGLFEADHDRYFRLINRSEDNQNLYSPDIFQNFQSPQRFEKIFNRPGIHSYLNKMTYFDLKGSLPALLHVEDRTSMSVSLESRVPLLDHHLIEFIATVPTQIKFATGKTKHLFREAIKNIIPTPVLNRTDKKGFPVPLNQWFKGIAKDFLYDTLFSQAARGRGLYQMDQLEKLCQQDQKYSRVLWGVLCLELWHREFIDR